MPHSLSMQFVTGLRPTPPPHPPGPAPPLGGPAPGPPPPPPHARLSRGAGRRARRVLDRYGVAGFGIAGPALFGTWGSALLGAALGIPRWRLIRWLMTGITLWCTVLLFASDAAFAIFGIG
ncbi:hypothetical protein [Nocardia cyriacigeorgica]|uniref:hypothetical protein n=1 Tax=Nocardia cyriacigeorgica TaxID=135487 RepID=UPI0024552BD6|nr:hypothetical protein [Nocardia cyriacigeorgica]